MIAASRPYLIAVFAIAGMIAGCAPERPSCSAKDAACLLKQYEYDTSRKPPTYASAYSIADVIPFEAVAKDLKSLEGRLDASAMAHLLDAYFEEDPMVCADAHFAASLSSERSQIIANGPGDAISVIESIHC